MGALEIALTVGGIVLSMLWEYYRETQAAKSEADVEVDLNTPTGDVVTINDMFKVTLEAGSISDKTIKVEKGKLDIPGRETIELEDATINLKKMKIKSPHLEKPINLKKIEKAVNKANHEEEQQNDPVDLGDIAEDIVDVVEDAVETAVQPNAKNITSVTSSALKLLGHIGSWVCGTKKGSDLTEEHPLIAVNTLSAPKVIEEKEAQLAEKESKDKESKDIDIITWIEQVNAMVANTSSGIDSTEIPTNTSGDDVTIIKTDIIPTTPPIDVIGETPDVPNASAAA